MAFIQSFIGAGLAMAIVTFLLKAYIGSYLNEKGKNFATKEDIDILIAHVRATEELKADIAAKMWDRQSAWAAKRDHYEHLADNLWEEVALFDKCIDTAESFQEFTESFRIMHGWIATIDEKTFRRRVTLAALYMSTEVFKAVSELSGWTKRAFDLLNQSNPPGDKMVTLALCRTNIDRLFLDVIAAMRRDLGYGALSGLQPGLGNFGCLLPDRVSADPVFPHLS